jgi:hypothetical protein
MALPKVQAPIDSRRRQLLTIFWEGTANTVNPITTQIGFFSKACCGVAVSSPDQVPADRRCPLKLSFDGCGVTHGGFWGGLFAHGLDEQCDLAINIIQKMLMQQQEQLQQQISSYYCNDNSDKEVNRDQADGVHVVAVGFSRGGVACMKLAQKLAKTFCTQQPQIQTALMYQVMLYPPDFPGPLVGPMICPSATI